MAKKAKTDAGRLAYVPAGFYSRYQGLSVYTRFKKEDRKKHGLSVLEQGRHHVIIDAPDRVIMLVDNVFHEHSSFQTQGWHEMQNLSHYHPGGNDLPLEFVMTNYTESIGVRENFDTNPAKAGGQRLRNTQIISDSGGFQIAVGDCEFIDPVDEIKWVNDNADLGMVLDIPCTFINDFDLSMRCARVQKLNNAIWLEQKSDELELINIFHGYDVPTMEKYRKIAEHQDIDRVAVGGIGFYDVFTGIDRAVNTLVNLKEYKHHHFLGITDRQLLVMLMYMSKLGLSRLITFDSTSASRLAAYKNFLHLPISEKGIKIEEDFGCKHNYISSHSKLACNCPVCSAVVFEDVLRSVRGNVIDSLLGLHTHYIYNDWVRTTHDIIVDQDKKTIKQFLEYQFGRNKAHDLGILLDYIDEVQESGYEKAREKFSFHFRRRQRIIAPTTQKISLDTMEAPPPSGDHIRIAVERYEQYHKVV